MNPQNPLSPDPSQPSPPPREIVPPARPDGTPVVPDRTTALPTNLNVGPAEAAPAAPSAVNPPVSPPTTEATPVIPAASAPANSGPVIPAHLPQAEQPVVVPPSVPPALPSMKPQSPPTPPAIPENPVVSAAGPSSATVVSPPAAETPANSLLARFKTALSIILFVAGVAIAALLINQFVFQSYYVDGTSMTPTLQNNDRLIIDKIGRTVAGLTGRPYLPSRGSIVVLDSSLFDQNGNKEQLIKRVIGLPGDTIIVANGVVTVKNAQNPNGFDVDQQLGLHLAPTFSESTLEVTVPAGKVFVMGDNRLPNGSYDSRAFGPIDSTQIEGRLVLRIFPLGRTGVF